MSTEQLEGKAVLVTGATSGIGLATAIRCASAGARIVLVARDEARLSEVASGLAGSGHRVAPADLSNLDSIHDLVVDSATTMGGLDGLVHAAGRHVMAPLRAMRADDMLSLYAINVVAGAMLAKSFRTRQVRKDTGSIVLMASAVGLVGQAGVTAYSASKGAVVSMTKSLALELAREQIRVNCVCPGIVETPMSQAIEGAIGAVAYESVKAAHPGGVGDPVDVAHLVAYLLSDESTWMTGSAVTLDGGYTAQ